MDEFTVEVTSSNTNTLFSYNTSEEFSAITLPDMSELIKSPGEWEVACLQGKTPVMNKPLLLREPFRLCVD